MVCWFRGDICLPDNTTRCWLQWHLVTIAFLLLSSTSPWNQQTADTYMNSSFLIFLLVSLVGTSSKFLPICILKIQPASLFASSQSGRIRNMRDILLSFVVRICYDCCEVLIRCFRHFKVYRKSSFLTCTNQSITNWLEPPI